MASGANDVMTKPMTRELLLSKVFHHAQTFGDRMALRRRVWQLEAELVQMVERNARLEVACLCVPIYLTAARDADTGGHLRRTQAYLALLIRRMRGHPNYGHLLTDDMVRNMVFGAALHDVGKVGLPDHILLKAGRFDAEERALMERHSDIGGDAIASAQSLLGPGGAFLQAAQDMARYHHERWDGRGYPSGLSGQAIPLAARIMAVVDVFDALVSKRVYKSSLDFDQARAVMEQERGGLFDPQILELFLTDYPAYAQIAHDCPDHLERSLFEVFQLAEGPVADH
jgi:putative two-component system response regulator